MTAVAPRLEIWLADLRQLQPALEAAEKHEALLSHSERAWDAAPDSTAATRRLSRIALRLLLARWGLGEACRAEFSTEPQGKPRLAGDAAQFSLSHTRDRALVAIAGSGPIGVDLEADRTIQLGTARLSLLIAAADAMSAVTADREDRAPVSIRSVQAWTALEAFAKARGSGIGALLTDVGITASGARAPAPADAAARASRLLCEAGLEVRRLQLPPGWHGAIAAPEILFETAPTVRELTPPHCTTVPGCRPRVLST